MRLAVARGSSQLRSISLNAGGMKEYIVLGTFVEFTKLRNNDCEYEFPLSASRVASSVAS